MTRNLLPHHPQLSNDQLKRWNHAGRLDTPFVTGVGFGGGRDKPVDLHLSDQEYLRLQALELAARQRDDASVHGGLEPQSNGYGRIDFWGNFARDRQLAGLQSLHVPIDEVGHAGKGPRSFQRSDAAILDDVVHMLTEHHALDAIDVVVHVENGIVTLSGTVATSREKWLAEDETEQIPGVMGVRNKLRRSQPHDPGTHHPHERA